jgi:hypothetical protein
VNESPSLIAFRLRSAFIDRVVRAADQWEAWDTLRDRPASHFGLIVTAEPDESADPIPVQTATLMRRWGRNAAADLFDTLAREKGLL